MAEIKRRKTFNASIGGVRVGSDAPVMVQSMTNTDTADVASTVNQAMALAQAGSELVRVTVNNDAAAEAVPHIVDGLDRQACGGTETAASYVPTVRLKTARAESPPRRAPSQTTDQEGRTGC